MEKDARKLGKGLGALLGGGDLPIASNSVARIKQDSVGKIRIDSIEVNPNQPRTKFDEEALRELAESIKTYGLIQPITVRPIANGKYQLISGERRLRACKLAGLQEIPTNHSFYELEGSNNIVTLTTKRYKEYPMLIQGFGAGASVTAAGVFANVLSIANI